MKTSHIFFNNLIAMMLTFLSVAILLIIFEMVRPYNVNQIDTFTVPDTIYRGVETHYEITGCKRMDLVGQVSVNIENSEVYQLFTKAGSTTAGDCPHKVLQNFIVPEFLIPGTYQLHFTAVYHPNIFRTIKIDAYSNDFTLR